MKRSRYVVQSFSADSNSRIFYNLRNGLGIKVANAIARNFRELAAIPQIQPTLEKYGFVQQQDEESLVQSEYEKARESAPLHLVIMPHQNCNFRCPYCYEKFEKNKMEPEVEQGLIRFVEQRLSSGHYGTFSVSWFGGEPLLATDVIERLSCAFRELSGRYGVRYVATMTSNGYLLNEDVASKLFENQVNSFQITLDGDKNSHDSQRMLIGGQPTYDRIVDNLVRLSHRSDGFRVVIRMNVGPENAEHAEAYVREMKRLFGNDERFLLYFHNIGHYGGENDSNIAVCEENMAVKLTALTLDLGMNAAPIAYKVKPQTSCYAASPHSFVFGVDGKIYKCTVALYDERNQIGQLLPNGEAILNEELMTLWTRSGLEDTKCRSCFFAPSCQGDSCPLIRIEEGRSPCPEHKGLVAEIVTLMDRQGYKFVELI